MKLAILCNNRSENSFSRRELVARAKEKYSKVYAFGVMGEYVNDYYSEKTAEFVGIEANRNNTNPLVEVKSILSVKKQIKDRKIDSVIIYGVKNHPAMTIGAWLGGAKNILCVVNGRGNLFKILGIKGRLLRSISFPMLRIAYHLASSICFQNVDDRILFENKHLINNKNKIFHTGGSGVNLNDFPFQKLPKENRFLFLARITASKGVNEYIQAAQIVKKKYPDAIFDIVGPLDGITEKSRNELLKIACDNNEVIYHGATDNVSKWMGSCRFFIYPSYYPEGVPRCAIQGIATGRPIITCDTPGCKETVINGENGFLIQPKDIPTLSEKMIWMIENPDLVEKMAIKSRQYAEAKFDVNNINKIILEHLLVAEKD